MVPYAFLRYESKATAFCLLTALLPFTHRLDMHIQKLFWEILKGWFKYTVLLQIFSTDLNIQIGVRIWSPFAKH